MSGDTSRVFFVKAVVKSLKARISAKSGKLIEIVVLSLDNLKIFLK